jgi:N-acetyl-anhydromuramyl-L-alanine amidase AmpD
MVPVLHRGRPLIPVEELAMLGHEVDEEEDDVEPKQSVVSKNRRIHPSVDIARRPAARRLRSQGQSGHVAGIAEAQVVDVDDPGERPSRCHDDVLGCRDVVNQVHVMANCESIPEVKDGKLVSSKVTDKNFSKIEKGSLAAVHALIIHQTGATTAASSFSSYESGKAGAHFLIDSDGTIYQTARVNQKCWHIGNVRSRCYENKSCTPDEFKAVKSILFRKGTGYTVRLRKLTEHEATKDYPATYPTNSDAIGIELVGGFDDKTHKYATVTKQQNDSLAWLVATLSAVFKLADSDVYKHPQVSYKQPSEAASASWRQ